MVWNVYVPFTGYRGVRSHLVVDHVDHIDPTVQCVTLCQARRPAVRGGLEFVEVLLGLLTRDNGAR